MSEEEEARVRHHLEDCPRCQAELAALQGFLSQEPTLEPVPKAGPPLLSMANLRLLFVPSTPQFALRGAADPSRPVLHSSAPGPLLFEVEGVSVFLELEATPQGLRLRGQLIISDASQTAWSQALVELWQGEMLHATAILNDTGGFTCAPVAVGLYELRFAAPGGPRLNIDALEIADG